MGGEDGFLFLLVVTSSYVGLGTHSISSVACMLALPVEIQSFALKSIFLLKFGFGGKKGLGFGTKGLLSEI